MMIVVVIVVMVIVMVVMSRLYVHVPIVMPEAADQE